ncbi:ArgE/DapE family deacylase [Pseudomaricurvus alkylphenolicus]|uniref:ArgE/DapE family deacylase n=1 Tax=Pseudomaricurvus alkylphenolicus TaxID=1306991 RepID=UPI0014217D6E|nr:ArgE/DapE family deacylase [Pseudomaricurvus alkylphenolicus]NIB38571.1 ArgE/DapE family deacylase [Pseudomaricurvus alkylphenolicus]
MTAFVDERNDSERGVIEGKILSICDQIFPEVINFTKEMVKQYGILNQEQGVLDVVERHLRDLSLPADRVPLNKKSLSEHPLYAPVEWEHDKKYNLVSTLNPQAKGKSLVFNGHLDVVDATPFDMWSRPPNEPWEKDGWLYGRGAGDMQSGVAAMIYAVHAIHKAGFIIDSPLTIQAVVEEECSGNGTLACLDQGYGGDFVLIPEPFGPQIHTGQVGVLWFKVICRGTPAHVLDTSAGVNAIERLQMLIPALKDLEAELNDQYRSPPYDQFDHPFNLSIGRFDGGNWASSVPAHAQMEVRVGFPPGMTANQIMQMVSDRIERATQRLPEFKSNPPLLRFHGFRSEGLLIDLQDPGIELLSQCHRSLTGSDVEHRLLTCTTDLRAFHFYSKTAGTCYGPIARNIHGIDECVNLESIRHTLMTYALFISRWCEIRAR